VFTAYYLLTEHTFAHVPPKGVYSASNYVNSVFSMTSLRPKTQVIHCLSLRLSTLG